MCSNLPEILYIQMIWENIHSLKISAIFVEKRPRYKKNWSLSIEID